MKCPHCKSRDVRRSRPRPEDGVLRMEFCSAYRCRDCDRRFFRLGTKIKTSAVVALLFGVSIALGWGLRGAYMHAETLAEPASGTPVTLPLAMEAANPTRTVEEQSLLVAAEQGDAKAQFQVGMSFLNGEGAARDVASGYKWLEKAAQQGHAEAQYSLGALHLTGRGALQSFAAAFKWFEKAAQQNFANAQYSLGTMYKNGHGIAPDKAKAYVWFNLAAAQGHERAHSARDQLLPFLSPEQLKAAQRESQEWQPADEKK